MIIIEIFDYNHNSYQYKSLEAAVNFYMGKSGCNMAVYPEDEHYDIRKEFRKTLLSGGEVECWPFAFQVQAKPATKQGTFSTL